MVALQRNVALLFLELGWPRATAQERGELLPKLLIATRPSGQQDKLLRNGTEFDG